MVDKRSLLYFKEELTFSNNTGHKTETIVIPESKSLYLPDPALNYFIEQLEYKIANDSDQGTVVVLRANGARADDLNDFVCFKPQHLRINVVKHILRLRNLFKGIRQKKSRFILVTDSDLLGSWFELGLMCDKIVSLDHLAIVGFPQLAFGFLPALGSLELESFYSKGMNQSFWEKGFLWNVLDVPDKISLHVVPIGLSPIDLENILVFNRHKNKLTKSLRSYRNLPNAGNWSGTKGLRKKYADLLWVDFWNEFIGGQSLQFSKIDTVLSSWFEAAEHSALSYSASGVSGLMRTEKFLNHNLNNIWVDTSHYLPPLKLLLTWLQVGVKVVFFANTAKALNMALKRVYDKLNVHLRRSELSDFWQNKISWTIIETSKIDSTSIKILRFFADGKVECVLGDQRKTYIRLATNDFDAKIGTAEAAMLPGEYNLEEEHTWAFGLLFRALICSNSIDTLGVPSSQWLRTCFLQQLISEASEFRNGLKDIFKWLSSNGWGVASNETWWKQHLDSRFSGWPVENGKDFFTAHGPVDDLRSVSSWQSIVNLVRNKNVGHWGSKFAPQRTVPNLFSEHMLLFAALLGLRLYKENIIKHIGEVDLIVRFSLEVPEVYGSPIGFIKRLGIEMVIEYVMAFFPNWNFTEPVEFFFSLETTTTGLNNLSK